MSGKRKIKQAIGDQGKSLQSSILAKENQVRGVRIACFISVLYEDVFWAILELRKPQFRLYFTFSEFFQKPLGGA